jgi:hypothetical protein
LAERNTVEEPQGADDLVQRRPRNPLPGQQHIARSRSAQPGITGGSYAGAARQLGNHSPAVEMFALARTGKMPARSSCSQDDGTVGLYISSYIVLQYIVLQTGASTSWGLVGAVERLDVGLISKRITLRSSLGSYYLESDSYELEW